MKYDLYTLVWEYKAEPDVRIDTTCVPIEVELTRKYAIVVIAASIEPRVRRVNEVRIVAIKSKRANE